MGLVIRGKNVSITGEGTADRFYLEKTENLDITVAGNTQGGEDANVGNDDWKGDYRLRTPNGAAPARFPGDAFTLTAGPETGAKGVEGPARCLAIEILWDIRNGRKIDTKVFYGANGVLTDGATVIADSSQPNPATSKGMYPIFNGDSFQNLHVDWMRLRIFVSNVFESVDSNAVTAGWTTRGEGDVGAIADWRMSTDDVAAFPTEGTLGNLKMYATSTRYWDINWVRIGGHTWLTDRRDGKRPVQGIVTARFSGFDGTTVGYIKTPAASPVTKWP